MPRANSGGIQIAYDDFGRGEPALLFLPGWCANRTAFEKLAPRCAASRTILSLDWRCHGVSGQSMADFGEEGLVEDALAVIEASRANRVVPVALAHSGWVAIELRRRLEDRIPKIVLIDWIVFEAPPPFLEVLKGMQSPDNWPHTVDRIFSQWLHGVDNTRLARFVLKEMGSYGFEMWARAAREIGAAYARHGSPLKALSNLNPHVPVLHLYAQPDDAEYLKAQQSFAASNPWFQVQKLEAQSHFPIFEVAEEMAKTITEFTGAWARKAA